MEQYLETETNKSDSLQRFIDRVKCVTQLTELPPPKPYTNLLKRLSCPTQNILTANATRV